MRRIVYSIFLRLLSQISIDIKIYFMLKLDEMSERRQTIRINESFKITYKVISPPDGWGNSVSMNISKGGIALPIDHRLIPGVVLDLQIKLIENTNPIEATGEVVWIKENPSKNEAEFPYLVGIKFINIDLRDRDRIYYYIEKRLSEKPSSQMKRLE